MLCPAQKKIADDVSELFELGFKHSALQLSRYKILFHFKASMWESIILVLPPLSCNAYPRAILLHAFCAIYAPQPTPPPPFVCHTPYTIGNCNIVYRPTLKRVLRFNTFRYWEYPSIHMKACSCTSSTTGAAYAASGAWRAYGRASHTLCLAGSPAPLWGSLVTCVVYGLRVRSVRALFRCFSERISCKGQAAPATVRLTRVGLCTRFDYFGAFVHESRIILLLSPTCIAHTIAMLMRDYCAIYDPPPDPPIECHTLYNSGNGNIV